MQTQRQRTRAVHWDCEDEKDISKHEHMLFSMTNFSFSHLPESEHLIQQPASPIILPVPLTLLVLLCSLGWQQNVFSFAAFPCLKFPG